MVTNDVEFDAWYNENKRNFYLHKLGKREVARKAWEKALELGKDKAVSKTEIDHTLNRR